MKYEIFTIWLTDEDYGFMPFFCEVCMASVQVFNPNQKVVLYTNHKLKTNFLSSKTTEIRQLDEYFPGLMEKAEELTKKTPNKYKKAHQSDYIRASILASGGNRIYLDSDIILFRSLDGIYDRMIDRQCVSMCKEDKIRCANGFLATKGNEGQEYFLDYVQNYDDNYIPASHSFNSMRYLLLLNRRYSREVDVLDDKEGFFYPNWDGSSEQMIHLTDKTDEIKSIDEAVPKFSEGYGVHIYKTKGLWEEMLRTIDERMYDKGTEYQDWYIIRLFQFVIKNYIELMKGDYNEE